MNKHAHGLTIVELLVVIVVIAILAALSFVGYTSISWRANNAMIINAASQSLKAMQAYIATEGTYPIAAGSACITAESGCHDSSGVISMRATFDTNMTVVGQLPRSIPSPHGERRGIFATYWSGATEGPVFLTYFLQGTSQ